MIGQRFSLSSIQSLIAKESSYIIHWMKKMASLISWGTWENFSSGALSIPKNERIRCFSSTMACASTWRMLTNNLRNNSSKTERKMTKKNQPMMNGSTLTRITEKLGK
jgi:hypothetical protein